MNGWQSIYFHDEDEIMDERRGYYPSNSVPNPIFGMSDAVRQKSGYEHVHPITNEPFEYTLSEFQYGDYRLKYLTAKIPVDDKIYQSIWCKYEPYSRKPQLGRGIEGMVLQQFETSRPKKPDPERYGVYTHVPGMAEFVKKYESWPFKEVWLEYDALMQERFGEFYTPLLPGTRKQQILSVFDAFDAEPIEDFVVLYELCGGNDDDFWLDSIEEHGCAYAHIGGNPLMKLSEIESEVKYAGKDVRSEYPHQSLPAGYVKNNRMLSNRIPIHHDGGGNFIAIDLDPDMRGTYGQIITVDHEYEEQVVLAGSLKEYITILYYFLKELGVIDNGEGYEGDRPLSSYINPQ
ncbi:SMI1/KNR4 family protein [Planococcus liqunii]|uniref:SMI1/KNR4 family protein n=1 Tax=Planococcus liqunii TaxID=3058394 RepID=UPI00261A9B66|nr:SMI1/KNR4 family protein [Planococcus sp. N056]WKA52891.1 SMI1/KNR4 family protein [Planococcus sp. N056]